MDSGPETFETIEQPIWIRNIITKAGFKINESCMAQYTTIKTLISVEKHGNDSDIITAMEFENDIKW